MGEGVARAGAASRRPATREEQTAKRKEHGTGGTAHGSWDKQIARDGGARCVSCVATRRCRASKASPPLRSPGTGRLEWEYIHFVGPASAHASANLTDFTPPPVTVRPRWGVTNIYAIPSQTARPPRPPRPPFLKTPLPGEEVVHISSSLSQNWCF